MTYLNNVLKLYVITLLFLISSVFAYSTLRADNLENVIMPDANIIGRINLQNINNSSIVKYIKSDETVASELKVDELNEILNKYGLSDKDFPSLVFGLKINTDKIKDINKGLDDNAKEFVFGLNSLKKISLDSLKNIILDASKKDGSNDVKIKTEKKEDINLLLIVDNDKTKEQPLAVTVLTDKKLIIGGSIQTVIDSVKRIKADKVDTLNVKINEIKSHVSKNADVYLIGYLSNDLREKLGLTYEQPVMIKGQSEKAPNADVFKDINAVLVEAVFQKKLDVDIVAYFINKSSAEQGSEFVNKYIPMLRFMVLGMTKGNQIPLMNTIVCNTVQAKPEVKLHLSFSEKDVDAIQKIVKQQDQKDTVQGLSEFDSN